MSARLPWWFWPLVIYIVARAINALMIVASSDAAIVPPHGGIEVTGYFTADEGPAPAGYFTTVTNWDGQWYWQIATHGYPVQIPRDTSGAVVQNVFAFFPLFPMAARALMAITGLNFPIIAILFSLTLGAVASLQLYRIVRRRSDALGARIAVVCLSAFTCAPVFLIAYADPLALVLVLSILWCVLKEKFLWAAVVLVPLAFTRNVVAAFALFFAVLAIVGWRRGKCGKNLLVKLMSLSAWSAVLTFAWPATVALRTGDLGGYFASQKAWTTDLDRLAILRFIDRVDGALGGAIVAGLVAALWAVLLLRIVTLRQPDPTLKTWSGMYGGYILLATNWDPTALRYFLLALPVFWPLTIPEISSRRSRILGISVLAVLGLISQWWWIRYVLTLTHEGVQVP